MSEFDYGLWVLSMGWVALDFYFYFYFNNNNNNNNIYSNIFDGDLLELEMEWSVAIGYGFWGFAPNMIGLFAFGSFPTIIGLPRTTDLNPPNHSSCYVALPNLQLPLPLFLFWMEYPLCIHYNLLFLN